MFMSMVFYSDLFWLDRASDPRWSHSDPCSRIEQNPPETCAGGRRVPGGTHLQCTGNQREQV